jgi:ubiquinone/menaquinone biosynthesis C-methylase UbiE
VSTSGATATGDVLHQARAYDLLVWVLTLGREQRFRERLVQLAGLAPGESALDVGCGTGSLAIAAKARVGPDGQVCGVDPSPEMVARADRKAVRAGVDVRFKTAAVQALPFPDATFDAVLSSLMLHHLTEESRRTGIREIARVLKPGGRFLAVDIGASTGKRRGIHRWSRRHAHFDLDELTPLFQDAGFQIVEQGPIGLPRMVGLGDLRFILTVAPPRRTDGAGKDDEPTPHPDE